MFLSLKEMTHGNYGRSAAFYGVLFAGLLGMWALFKEEASLAYVNWIGTLMKGAGDTALILLPYWLLAPRWRWTGLLPIWLFAVWAVANLAYFRFWGDFIPPSAVTMGGNVDGNLMEYGASLLKWSDAAFAAVTAAATAAYFFLRPDMSASYSIRGKAIMAAVSIFVGIAGQYSYFHSTYQWKNNITERTRAEAFNEHYFGDYTGQKQLYIYNGLVYYGVRCLTDMIGIMNSTVELSDPERAEIAGFLHHYGNPEEPGETVANSVNVVYVIVESLNSEMLGKEIGGLRILPTLDSLAAAPGTVLFDNVASQIKASSSSDGHLLLMTGLLPPDKVSYSIMYGSSNTFPSLADRMPRHEKHLLLADDGVCWNEGNTLRNFGLGIPLTTKDRKDSEINSHGRDGAMLQQAAEIVKRATQPFFMTLMTISMHIPFIEEGWSVPPEIENAKGLNRKEKDYANTCLHFDRYLGEFLKALPRNTIVIIASDHSQSVASGNDTTPAALLMAINTDRTVRISRKVGQVNLFPATLDILGLKGGYRGLAPSAFNPDVDGTRDSYGNLCGKPSAATLDTLGLAYRLSDLILRGDYFKVEKK